MSIENAIRNRTTLFSSLGKAGLNIKFPREFEIYVCALELIDNTGKTLRYFIFPVMPSAIDETSQSISNVKKTLAGVTVLSSSTFTPSDITLSGNFGRKFKILLGGDYIDFASSFKTSDKTSSSKEAVFDERVKTGFGCMKILEDIIIECNIVDEVGPRRLILYNPAFGNNYIVKPMVFKQSQSQESNMVPNYMLQLKTLAPVEAFSSRQEIEGQRARLNVSNQVQKNVNVAVENITSLLNSIIP